MTSPSIDRVQELARKHVLDADKKGTLHLLTPKLLRREIEKELGLEEGDLDSSEYKDAVKKAIGATMADLESSKMKRSAEETRVKPDSLGKSTTKGKKRTSDTGVDDLPKKKPRVAKKEENKDQVKQRKRKSKVVERKDSPMPPDQPMATNEVGDQGEPSPKKPPVKRRKIAAARIEDSDDESSDKILEPEPRTAKAEVSNTDVNVLEPQEDRSITTKQTARDEDKADYKSESELSVLIDEPPKKRKTKSEKGSTTNAKKASTKKSSKKSDNLSKDEETIKRLKALVLACGVRKVWSKVFQGLDTPSQQIKKLKEILRELGMTGRMSMEQAKAIRERRELAQELQDVQEFEKAVVKSGGRREGNNDKEKSEDEDNADAGGEDENPKPRRRKMNAARSILAFLGDQSSDED